MTSLTSLSLKSNDLEGGFPNSIGNMSCLDTLELSSNNLIGQLSGFFKNLSGGCKEKKLEFLYLWGNKITGSVPNFTRFSSLIDLGLGQNQLSGTIPKSIGQMFELQVLDLGDNSLRGVISEDFFLNLSKLDSLVLSHNSLFLEISDDWVPPFQHISYLSLASCKMGPHFPKWFRNLESHGQLLLLLDISNAGISDAMPNWMWDVLNSAFRFNISYNHIKGNLPDFSLRDPVRDSIIDMSSNHLKGPILSLPAGATHINLSGNKFSGSSSFICSAFAEYLTYLDLSNNLLSGMLPDCWIKFEELVVLNVASNGFSGKIPPSMGSLGFWGVCGSLVLSQSWRHAYFNFLADIKDKIYVIAAINFAKLKQRYSAASEGWGLKDGFLELLLNENVMDMILVITLHGSQEKDMQGKLLDDSDDETLSSVFKKSRKLHSKPKDDRLEKIQVEKTNEDAGNGGTADAKGRFP
ncbi:hypothetical protein Patl1_20273 [Pistacia atlantica]|uniref:Uncharacterized protein n=1 Tax=Pistacia atlantica TaxID=434234 RepID=A0ACC1BIW5_9ROSI|nr:hypothetical protein Patl1_20273 [Pistacia atlantica]